MKGRKLRGRPTRARKKKKKESEDEDDADEDDLITPGDDKDA